MARPRDVSLAGRVGSFTRALCLQLRQDATVIPETVPMHSANAEATEALPNEDNHVESGESASGHA